MRSVFDVFDSNQDGTICVSELMKLMQSCGQNPTDKDVEEIMKAVDKNGTNFVMPPSSKKLMGHIGLGRSVRPSVRACVRPLLFAYCQ